MTGYFQPGEHFAVLVVDMQERYFQKGCPLFKKRAELLGSIRVLLAKALDIGWPVYFTKEEYKSDFSDAPRVYKQLRLAEVIEGNPLAGIVAEFHSYIDSNVIVKKRHSSFEDTSLKQRLDELFITDLIIVGINTDTCVLSACLGARMDFNVIIPVQCVASSRDDMHDVALKLLSCKAQVVDLGSILDQGQGAGAI